MIFDFTETQLLIRETARKFANDELAGSAIERDEKEEFPHEAIRKLGELGFQGMMIPERYGGAGLDARGAQQGSIPLHAPHRIRHS